MRSFWNTQAFNIHTDLDYTIQESSAAVAAKAMLAYVIIFASENIIDR